MTRFARNRQYFGGVPAVCAPDGSGRSGCQLAAAVARRWIGGFDPKYGVAAPVRFGRALERSPGANHGAVGASAVKLGMNTEDARLRDPRVRRALALAIDRERIIRTKLRGKATLASSLLPPFHWAFHQPATSLAYNPDEAKRLLDELVFPTQMDRVAKTAADATLQDVDGCPAGRDCPRHRRPACGNRRRCRDQAARFHLFLSGREKNLSAALRFVVGRDCRSRACFATFPLVLHSERQNLDAGLNRMRYRNPVLDELLDQRQSKIDRDKRRNLRQGSGLARRGTADAATVHPDLQRDGGAEKWWNRFQDVADGAAERPFVGPQGGALGGCQTAIATAARLVVVEAIDHRTLAAVAICPTDRRPGKNPACHRRYRSGRLHFADQFRGAAAR